MVFFSAETELDIILNKIYVIINVDGVDITTSERKIDIKNIDIYRNISTQTLIKNVADNTIIKIRYKCSGGTVTFHHRSLIIYGS